MRCPECTSQRTRVVRNPTGTPTALSMGGFPATVVLIAINVIVYLIEVIKGSGGLGTRHRDGLRNGRPLGPGGARRRRLVADYHQRLRPRQHPPHRLQHVPAVLPGPAAGARDRHPALHRPLLRLAAGGLVLRPLVHPGHGQRRRLGRDLRRPRRDLRGRPRAPTSSDRRPDRLPDRLQPLLHLRRRRSASAPTSAASSPASSAAS